MNILFILIPKHEVVYLESTITVRRALMLMDQHTYTAVPLISPTGEYVGTVTEGDFLRYCRGEITKTSSVDLSCCIADMPRQVCYEPVSIKANIEDLISKVTNQNYVPVIDDNKKFIGIITRKDVIQHIYNKVKTQNA